MEIGVTYSAGPRFSPGVSLLPEQGISNSRSDEGFPNCSTTAACILGAIFNFSFILCPIRNLLELIHGMVVFLSKSDQSRPPNRLYVPSRGFMDHNESTRKLEQLMLREADNAHATATELEALAVLLPEKSRQLTQSQIKASHKQAKEFRELAQKAKES
jgi:hypothetical protein